MRRRLGQSVENFPNRQSIIYYYTKLYNVSHRRGCLLRTRSPMRDGNTFQPLKPIHFPCHRGWVIYFGISVCPTAPLLERESIASDTFGGKICMLSEIRLESDAMRPIKWSTIFLCRLIMAILAPPPHFCWPAPASSRHKHRNPPAYVANLSINSHILSIVGEHQRKHVQSVLWLSRSLSFDYLIIAVLLIKIELSGGCGQTQFAQRSCLTKWPAD